MYDLLAKKLKSHGYSLTKPRQAVFAALQSGTPRSMRELYMDLSSVIDRASIYRTVALFEELGIVAKVTHGWKYKIELSGDFAPHHHHISCTKCGKIVSFDEPPELDEALTNIILASGFKPTGHSLEIYGVCPACQAYSRSE